MDEAQVSKQKAFLRGILEPRATAVLTMEMQNGVVGEGALLPALAEEVERVGMVSNVRRICEAARDSGARVVHCTAVSRADGAGVAQNCRIFVANERLRLHGRGPTEIGQPGADVLEVLRDPRDIEVPRLSGMTPFTSTSLDQLLRNLDVRTVVATGVSLNLGIMGMALSALDLGYQVVVVRDATAGVPAEYGQAVLEHSLSLIATIVTTDDVVDVLGGG
ncbi:MAG: cysteine hydrolase [Acidimicrobiales bacterium]